MRRHRGWQHASLAAINLFLRQPPATRHTPSPYLYHVILMIIQLQNWTQTVGGRQYVIGTYTTLGGGKRLPPARLGREPVHDLREEEADQGAAGQLGRLGHHAGWGRGSDPTPPYPQRGAASQRRRHAANLLPRKRILMICDHPSQYWRLCPGMYVGLETTLSPRQLKASGLSSTPTA